ncbi:IPT/TIG domain-containing protein [Chitinophaga sp. YIM B06452]|uniref:IPT/TIG domain-containing protein n=1 Tax=Chitinophaga sp. YIM B06452 TaxID=3082158 RepID=UPI0031FF4365
MKRHIYSLFAVLVCAFTACRKEVIDVRDFGKVTIDRITPGTGPAGTYVVVYGHNFTDLVQDAKVHINDMEVRIVTMSPDSMLIQIPEGAVTGKLEFSFNRKNPYGGYDYSGQAEPAATGPVYTVDASAIPLPMVREVLPLHARVGGEVTVNGYNFKDGSCKIFFGDTEGTITEISSNQVKVKVPAITPDTVSMRVEQGAYTVPAGQFIVDETPAGVKEIFWASPGKVYKAVLDENGNAIMEAIYDESDNAGVYLNGLTVDKAKGRVYWLDFSKVYYGSLDGAAAPTLVHSFPEGFMLTDIAFDSQDRLYVMAFDATFSGNTHILRVNTDGTGAEEIYKLGEMLPTSLKIDEAGGKIYWTDQMNMITYEGSVNGQAAQAPKALFDANDGVFAPSSIAMEGTHIYIMDGGTSAIFVGERDGSGTLTKLPVPAEVLMGAGDLEIDAGNQYIYWIQYDFMVGHGTLFRCKTDGTGLQRVIENVPESYHLSIVL